ncbi:hypothetical protein LINGRAHAP2_LOCUS36520 [Linum grandiflorum]
MHALAWNLTCPNRF